MGQEISSTGFTDADFTAFSARVEQETGLLKEHYQQGRLSTGGPVIGLELEAWLIDRNYFPAPHNQSFLKRLNDPFVVAELSRFNIELNAPPQHLADDGLALLELSLSETWAKCRANAHEDIDTLIAIGTLPTLRETDLTLSKMTPSNRYVALNTEVIRARDGNPLRIEIDSADPANRPLRTSHLDCMLEAATTSFQLHLQVPPERLSQTLNASMILSAPLVALAANSPFLFGHALWHETRIPLFEQSVEAPSDVSPPRVTFGNGFQGPDPTVIFGENLAHYAPLLPFVDHDAIEGMGCLRLHNGTIWRWNRPLVGFDEDGTPHLRIEQRVMPAGPTILDMMANAAFYYGAVHMLAQRCADAEALLPFATARDNFYEAAKHGLGAELTWFDGEKLPVRKILKDLVDQAEEGLADQGVNDVIAERYLDTVAMRISSGQNGAAWQLAHHKKHGDLNRLTADYLEHQRSGMPVHEWAVD